MEKEILELKGKIESLEKTLGFLSNTLTLAVKTIVSTQKLVEERFNNVDAQLSLLKGDSVHTIVSLESGLNNVLDELKKINDATGYSAMYENIVGVKKDTSELN